MQTHPLQESPFCAYRITGQYLGRTSVFSMDDTEMAGNIEKPRRRKRVSWKCVAVVFMFICNIGISIVLMILLIPLRSDVQALKLQDLQEKVVSKSDGLGSLDESIDNEAGKHEHLPSVQDADYDWDAKAANRTRRAKRKKKSCSDCDCSIQKKRRFCRNCCRTQFIPEKMKELEKTSKKLNRRFRELKRNMTVVNDLVSQMQATDTRENRRKFIETHDALYESRLGHFVGSDQPNAECKNTFVRDERLETNTGGLVCLWKAASWMTAEAKQLYELVDPGVVKVNEDGIYFIYGQIIQADMQDYASASIRVRGMSNMVERTLAKCSETAGSQTSKVLGETIQENTLRTCYLGVLVKLQTGQMVYIQMSTGTTGIPLVTYHKVETAYFGFIKFA